MGGRGASSGKAGGGRVANSKTGGGFPNARLELGKKELTTEEYNAYMAQLYKDPVGRRDLTRRAERAIDAGNEQAIAALHEEYLQKYNIDDTRMFNLGRTPRQQQYVPMTLDEFKQTYKPQIVSKTAYVWDEATKTRKQGPTTYEKVFTK